MNYDYALLAQKIRNYMNEMKKNEEKEGVVKKLGIKNFRKGSFGATTQLQIIYSLISPNQIPIMSQFERNEIYKRAKANSRNFDYFLYSQNPNPQMETVSDIVEPCHQFMLLKDKDYRDIVLDDRLYEQALKQFRIYIEQGSSQNFLSLVPNTGIFVSDVQEKNSIKIFGHSSKYFNLREARITIQFKGKLYASGYYCPCAKDELEILVFHPTKNRHVTGYVNISDSSLSYICGSDIVCGEIKY